MQLEIKVPSVGESVTEATLAQWYKKDGDQVRKGELLFVLETDKVTLEIEAEADGVLQISKSEGETIPIGAVVGTIDRSAAPEAAEERAPADEKEVTPAEAEKPAPPKLEKPPPAPPAERPPAALRDEIPSAARPSLPPSVRRLVAEKNLDVSKVTGTGPGGRITKGDVLLYLEQAAVPVLSRVPATQPSVPQEVVPASDEPITRKPMSQIRQRIAARLVEAKQNTAMLTTFNEIDMTRVQEIRAQYKEPFQKKYGVRLGIMSFFIRACVEALMEFPELNAYIENKDIIYHDYYHLGVAIGAERGLVVPVIRHADKLSFAQLEHAIIDYVKKIQENRLELADLEGGTFTITNGGVFGSLLSTPILNIPQSGILGMHKIESRPVVIDGEITVRPMMYVALTYDHRIVDGRQAVTFLVRIKEFIQEPDRIMIEI
ncbi:MAG: 2-oxoglutarate dehydrogenase complex dihydrolipoyllysine-residue succinyltransferase [Deltaproteobacteria bacterium]|nr:2-oxoglutarate dehydrogenase complex dihydrolipoyllysine-residue succinyltransferase [Deltaproteobacteria bacterium]